MKLEQACHLLVDGGASVTETALAAGLKSRSYFSRCYRREFGRLPRSGRP